MRPSRIAFGVALVAAAALAMPASAGKAAPFKGGYLVGADVQSINPTTAMIKAGDFYLGGYGLGSGKALNKVPLIEGRAATGILKDPLFKNGLADGSHVRSIVIGAGGKAMVLSQIETQGMFAAYKQGPFGLVDIRKDAAAAINKVKRSSAPAVTAGAILVDSNHSHAGPDTAGVWGGVPTTYLKLIHDQTVKSIVNAYQRMQSVDLYFGVAHAGVSGEPQRYPSKDPLLTNQFSKDPNNQEVDDELRVLQARGAKGKVIATYLNYSSHPTVLGGGNTLVSADYTGPLAAMLSTLGGTGIHQVGTLGRTQPARDSCPDPRLKGSASDVCKINSYASRVFARTKVAIKAAKKLPGTPIVSLHSYFVQDLATNAPIVGLTYAGVAAGAPIYRAANPPWMTGTVLGSTSFSGRIGDILLSGGPGEMYPQVVQTVREAVKARGHINIGTAGDFLGYIIAPLESYPEPLRRGFFDGDAPPKGSPDCTGGASPVPIPSPIGCPDPISNDNYFFNASHTLGERLTCSLLRGAGEVMKDDGQAYWLGSPRCLLFANDFALPADVDTTFPSQPDLSALPGFDH
jgi:hypothetical protein